ncbi:hypothetical protein [Pseudomonas sp. PB103]|uniref:hypothetical protein n=1 Tax=unclassified Pseudomonas TaxID=196821 RepID=UPI00131AF231|nr:hypothetical protein [Pseudomonas sp. PB103]KAE9640918.1 hypothetical protein EJA70_23795 [Pseudomonas sp. PB103]
MALAEMLLSGVLALICTMSVVSTLNLSASQHFFRCFDVSPLYGGSKPRQWEKTEPNLGAAEGCDLLIFGVPEYAKDRSLRQLLQEVKSVECSQVSAVRMNHRHKKTRPKPGFLTGAQLKR